MAHKSALTVCVCVWVCPRVESSAFCDHYTLFMRWVIALKIRIIKKWIHWRQSAATKCTLHFMLSSFEHLLWICAYVCARWPYHHINRDARLKWASVALLFTSIVQHQANIFFSPFLSPARSRSLPLHTFSIKLDSFNLTLLGCSVHFIRAMQLVREKRCSNCWMNFALLVEQAMPIGMLTQWYLHFSQIFLITCWRLNAILRKRFVFVVVGMWLELHYFVANST